MSEKDDTLDGQIRCRIEASELDAFKEKTLRQHGKPYQLMLREFIVAYNTGNLRIINPDNTGELYVTGK